MDKLGYGISVKLDQKRSLICIIQNKDKRRKVGPEAVFGVRVGTEQLDRLWNTTEDNTSGAMRCGACSGMCRVWGLTVSPAVVLSGGCLDWSALLTHLLPVSPDYHPSAPPHPPCPARPLLPASQR